MTEPAGVFEDEIMVEHQVWERIEQFVVGTNAVAMVPAVGVVEDVAVDAVVAAVAEELLVLGQRVIEPAEGV